ncbi:D-amino acid aminotransferase [Methylococcus capsulatus]|jgi:D-alanine transaminase|uniref:Aminodeoxychorismate lyase n=1 Tax=Methylococcus capsulatus TaxID=414 RepID=A0AA35XUL8_METCP|nr:D-amino acid aminotransferase [Methylococcus capsulatus]CAI8785149.1 D-alanine aminotransferase [Methylococcus capsulatus]
MNGPVVYLNGEFLPLDQARVSVLDRGFLFGDGVYEVIPVYGGRPLRLEEHLRRLDDSLRGIRMTSPLMRSEWSEIIGRLIDGVDDQSVYVQVTRGVGPARDHSIPVGVRPTVFAMASPITPVPVTGVRAITLEDIRWRWCNIKAITLLPNVLLRQQAVDRGCAEAVLVREGHVTEGTASNVFAVVGGTIVTPPKGPELLPGITRDLVLELVRAEGLPARERAISLEEFSGAEEIWITSSTREVLPVVELDGRPVGRGSPGPVWERVSALYQDFKRRLKRGITA